MSRKSCDPDRLQCFRDTEFVCWDPGTQVILRNPPPTALAWLLQTSVWGIAIGLPLGVAIYLGVFFALWAEAISLTESLALGACLMATIGAMQLAGATGTRRLEINWSMGNLNSSSQSGTRSLEFGDLKALVVRAVYSIRSWRTGAGFSERVYRASLSAESSGDELLLLDTDSRDRDENLAVEKLEPFARELADTLELDVRTEEPVEERHAVGRALARAPGWMRALFVVEILALACWIVWRAQPVWSAQGHRDAVEAAGGTFYSRQSWRIGGTQYGPVDGISFEDQALTDQTLLDLRESLSKFKRFQLILSGTPISDAGLRGLAGNEGLVAIDLYGTQVTDRGVETLSRCPALIEINLNRTRVSDASLHHFTSLKNLASLQLWGTRVSDLGVPDLLRLKTLRDVNLTDSSVTSDGLLRLNEGLPDADVYP